MDVLGLITLPGWLVAIVSIVFTLFMYTFYKQSIFRRIGVPGPQPVPFLGILPIWKDKGVMKTDLDMVNKYGKVCGIYLGNIPQMIVCDLDMIKQICVKQFSKFQDRARDFPAEPFLDPSVLQAVGEDWKFLRSTLSPTFSSGKMRDMNCLIQRCTDSLLDVLSSKAETNEPTDMLLIYQAFTMDVICSTAFGVDVDAQKDPDNAFVKNARAVFNVSITGNPGFLLTMFFPFLRPIIEKIGVFDRKAMQFFRDATRDVIAVRKKSDSKFRDLVQLMVNAHRINEKGEVDETERTATAVESQKRRHLTDHEMLANSIVFMTAGYETTAITLTMATHNITAHPDVQEKLIAEIDRELGKEKPTYDAVSKLPYLDMVVNETLRLYTPGFRFNRDTLEDVEICGQFIPKGMNICISPYAIHRDERYWPDPEKFDPERFAPENKATFNNDAFMPFGMGPRICIGMRLAQLEIRMALVTLLQSYRLKPAPGFKIPPKLKDGRPKPADGSVVVYLEPRSQE